MKINNQNYMSPEIKRIRLDNEISLILLSDAPEGPGEGAMNQMPENFNNQEPVWMT
jgi:hypothetical protein